MTVAPWDLFCRVIDNHGDVGVCWRLAADLASRGQPVRLWIDEPSALAWMAPEGAAGVSVLRWPGDGGDNASGDSDTTVGSAQRFEPGPVVIEAFGCELPPAFVAAMASMPKRPVWLDLEYLSAEDYVERSHRLPSPQTQGPGAGLVKHFFYPGFTAATGGLIRERRVDESASMNARDVFDAAAWLGRFGIERRSGERIVSLFCYEQPAFAALLDCLAEAPTLLLLTAGHAARQAAPWLADAGRAPRLRLVQLPRVSQADYDRLLGSSDLNFVRGEDSFVRAQWAGKPFIWQAYPQADRHHLVKVQAFLERHLDGVGDGLAAGIERLWSAWNGGAPPAALKLPASEPWRRLCVDWRSRLKAQPDLSSSLLRFAADLGATDG